MHSQGADASPEEHAISRHRDHLDGFAALYRTYMRQIHAFAYRRTGDRQVAEDITAATFEQAYRHFGRFEGRQDDFRAWLYRIAANQVTDHYRREARRRSPRTLAAVHRWRPDEQDNPYEAVDARLDSARAGLIEAMSTLRARHQEALSLRYLAGLSLREVASALNCSVPTASVTLHRAVSALRRALEEGPEVPHEDA